jgi:serine/threonine protein phosphatase PrpC
MPDSESGIVRSYPAAAMREFAGLRISGLTDKGTTRLINEDRWTQFDSVLGTCVLVADGLGGQKAGERAAELVVELLPRYMSRASPEAGAADVIRDAAAQTNRDIYRESQSSPDVQGMGSTMVLALISPDELTIAHCGDSRAYLYSRGKLTLLTNDHTLGREMVASKVLTKKQAQKHPKAGLLTRCMGVHEEVEVEVQSLPRLSPADSILLCSDGLSRHTTEQEIAEILARHSTEAAASALVALGLAHSTDNVTVVLAQAEGGIATPPPVASSLLRDKKTLAGISAAAVCAAAGLLYYGTSGKVARRSAELGIAPVVTTTITSSNTATTTPPPSAAPVVHAEAGTGSAGGLAGGHPERSQEKAAKHGNSTVVPGADTSVLDRQRSRVVVQLLASPKNLPTGAKRWLSEWTKKYPRTYEQDLRYPHYYSDSRGPSGGTMRLLKNKAQKSVVIIYNTQHCSRTELDDLVRDVNRTAGVEPGVSSLGEDGGNLGKLGSDLAASKGVCAVVLLSVPSGNPEP